MCIFVVNVFSTSCLLHLLKLKLFIGVLLLKGNRCVKRRFAVEYIDVVYIDLVSLQTSVSKAATNVNKEFPFLESVKGDDWFAQ